MSINVAPQKNVIIKRSCSAFFFTTTS
jgi:hypothetical protein